MYTNYIMSENTEQSVKKLFKKLYENTSSYTIKFNKKLTPEDFLTYTTKYYNQNEDRRIIIAVGHFYYTLSIDNIIRIRNAISNNYMYNQAAGYTFSDSEFIDKIRISASKINIRSYMPIGDFNILNQGQFFKYYVKDKFIYNFLNMRRYGIHLKYDKNDLIDNCLIEALEATDIIYQHELDTLKRSVKCRSVPLKCIKKFAIDYNLYIEIKSVNILNPKLDKVIKYGDKESKRQIKLGLIDEHYFIHEKINITNYSLKNYSNLKDRKKWNEFESKNDRNKKKMIDSVKMFKVLLKNKEKMLKDILLTDDIYKTQYFDKVEKIKDLGYEFKCVKPVEKRKSNKTKGKKPIVFFDCETCTEGEAHELYLICAVFYDGNGKLTRQGIYNSPSSFINDIKIDSVVIAHNLGYDFRFIVSAKELTVFNIIDKGNKIMKVDCINNHTKIKLFFKDSAFLITAKLSDFPKMFDVKGEKEIIPYGCYTSKTIKLNDLKIKEAIEQIKKEKSMLSESTINELIEQFKLNIKEKKLQSKRKGYFYHMKYSEFYCMRDCEILAQGYYKFRRWMIEITELDINDYISIPSIADNYLINNGCYDDVYEVSSHVREFIQSSIVGGRCMTNSNKKYHIKERLQDFDACSLYPSACYRMPGFLKGMPKLIDQDMTYEDIKKFDGYFVEVKFNRITRKYLDFPLLSVIDSNGSRKFTNEIKDEVFVLGKTYLEDVIKFHHMKDTDFEIIRGYFFNEGFNNGIQNKIKFLYDQRIIKKKEGNKIESIYKLLMNSIYGKTIMKPIDVSNKVIRGEADCLKHVYRNNNFVKYFIEIGGDKYMVKKIKPIHDHFSRPHVGSEILSYSKRIMNEVMTIAQDNNIKIYYQDTDSMHIQENGVDKLVKLFKKEYGRELNGDYLGQFHTDFSAPCDKGSDISSVESYFLGKKCYIDKLEFIKDGVLTHDYHIRLKGIPSDSIKCLGEPMDTYKTLSKGDVIEFDLLKSGCKFEFTKDFKIHSKADFKRKVSFNRTEIFKK